MTVEEVCGFGKGVAIHNVCVMTDKDVRGKGGGAAIDDACLISVVTVKEMCRRG